MLSDQNILEDTQSCFCDGLSMCACVFARFLHVCVQVEEDVIEQLKGIIDCSRHGEDFYGSDMCPNTQKRRGSETCFDWHACPHC
jgi:hypothetical protein